MSKKCHSESYLVSVSRLIISSVSGSGEVLNDGRAGPLFGASACDSSGKSRRRRRRIWNLAFPIVIALCCGVLTHVQLL